MIDTKAHYRRLVCRLGGIDAVVALTGRKRQTIAAYHNADNAQQPTADIMIELQAAAEDFTYQQAVSAVLGINAHDALAGWRQAHATAYLRGEHDQRFMDAVTPPREKTA